jgi:hypothetical protein
LVPYPAGSPLFGLILQLSFHRVDHVAGDLWGKDAEIVGKDDKDQPQEEAPPVFPKVFIYSL